MTRAATVRQCAILAGGLGTRLGALAADRPKPIIPIGGRPFLAWLMRELQRFGVEEFVLLSGHLSEVLRNSVQDLSSHLPKASRIIVSEEPVRAGTGGALGFAREHLDERFLLCNGDSLFDANLGPLLADAAAAEDGEVGRLLVRELTDTGRFGVVELSGGLVSQFHERGRPGAPGLINGGIYVLDRRILDDIAGVCSLERDVLPELAARGTLGATLGDGFFIDIGVPDELARAEKAVPQRLHRRALFLDRDGVINTDHGWVGTRDRFDWTPGALDLIRTATTRGWHVFVVTNQAGVARGFYGEDDVVALHAWIAEQARQAGGTIDDFRYCPYHPEAKVEVYRCNSDWRKPAPGMVIDLIRAWSLDSTQCILVGDQPTDVQAAEAAGVEAHLFPGGDLFKFAEVLLR
jgi:D,D-heptose 1,7-bisphosphate phosphatase